MENNFKMKIKVSPNVTTSILDKFVQKSDLNGYVEDLTSEQQQTGEGFVRQYDANLDKNVWTSSENFGFKYGLSTENLNKDTE